MENERRRTSLSVTDKKLTNVGSDLGANQDDAYDTTGAENTTPFKAKH